MSRVQRQQKVRQGARVTSGLLVAAASGLLACFGAPPLCFLLRTVESAMMMGRRVVGVDDKQGGAKGNVKCTWRLRISRTAVGGLGKA